MAFEIGIPYTLTAPDGTRAVFNDRANPSFVGFLDGEEGITGLDSPAVRAQGDDVVGGDGGLTGPGFYGRRPITLKGVIDAAADMATVNERVDRLLDIVDQALNVDVSLTWQETGRAQTMLTLRKNVEPRVNGRRPKTFLLGLVSEDDRIVSTVEKSAVILITQPSGGGIVSPLTAPLASTARAVGSQVLVNSGRKGARPRVRFDGPLTNFSIVNVRTGQQVTINYSLAAGEYMILETRPGRRSLLLQGSISRWGAINFAVSAWWELAKGANEISLNAYTADAGGQATVYWRDTWMS